MHAPPSRPRPVVAIRLLTVAALVVGLGLGVAAGPAVAAGRETRGTASDTTSDTEPLRVVLTSLSPSVVPKSGPLVVTGTVLNTSQQDWRTINVSAITSTSPMTTSSELAAAAGTPVDAFVGNRFGTPNSFAGVGDLGPGESTTFRLRIPRDELPIGDEAGVYWFGVQALATDDDGRGIEGRARTFIPVVRSPRSSATVSLVLPFREEVERSLDDQVADPDDLVSLLGSGGRLGRLLALSESAGAAPVTLLLDPAVLDAVQSIGQGNPARRTTNRGSSRADAGSGGNQGQGSDSDSDQTPPGDTRSTAARDWLARLQAQAGRDRVLGLGYADPDTAALAAQEPRLLSDATTQSSEAFADLGIDAQPAAAPADGLLPTSATGQLGRNIVVLLSDAATASSGSSGPALTASGQPLVLADSASASGGPAPGPTTSALAVRQRIVAEAALRAQAGSKDPLVVSLPADWDPGAGWRAADFFTGLDRPWLDLAPLDTAAGGPTVESLRYPATAEREQLGEDQLRAARSLDTASRLYADTLRRPGDILERLQRLCLGAASYHQRDDAGGADRASGLARWLRARLSEIKVVGNDFVTLSGGSGSIVVTLVNDLDQTARVGVSVRSPGDLRISSSGLVTLPPGQRTTVPLKASSDNNGVRAVRVTAVTPEGAAVGTPLRFSVRSSQVSLLVWGLMAAAGVLLVGMIVRRAVRRGLHRDGS